MKFFFMQHIEEKSEMVKNRWEFMKEFSDDFTELNNNFYNFYGSVENSVLISFKILDYTKVITKEYAVILVPTENGYEYNLIHIMYLKDKNLSFKDFTDDYTFVSSYGLEEMDKLWDGLNRFMIKEPQLIGF